MCIVTFFNVIILDLEANNYLLFLVSLSDILADLLVDLVALFNVLHHRGVPAK